MLIPILVCIGCLFLGLWIGTNLTAYAYAKWQDHGSPPLFDPAAPERHQWKGHCFWCGFNSAFLRSVAFWS